jgi:hypothetical protein
MTFSDDIIATESHRESCLHSLVSVIAGAMNAGSRHDAKRQDSLSS